MAKSKCAVYLEGSAKGNPNFYDAWLDDEMAPYVEKVPGVYKVVSTMGSGPAPYYILLDPRYDPAEVEAELRVLKADGKEPRGDTPDSLRAEAADLGKRAAELREASGTGNAYLLAADQVHGHSTPWLYSVRACVESLCKNRGLDPQPEPSLAEAARALGQKAGAAGIPFTVAKQFLEAAEKTYGKSYPEVLPGIIRIIAERIEFCHWC